METAIADCTVNQARLADWWFVLSWYSWLRGARTLLVQMRLSRVADIWACRITEHGSESCNGSWRWRGVADKERDNLNKKKKPLSRNQVLQSKLIADVKNNKRIGTALTHALIEVCPGPISHYPQIHHSDCHLSVAFERLLWLPWFYTA